MKRLLAYLPTLLVLIGITYVSLLREPSFSLPRVTGADKVAHVVMYAVLACVFVWDSWRSGQRKVLHWGWMMVALGAFALYGGVIELLQEQYFYPRTGTWGDWIADCAGCLVGVVLYLLLWKHGRKN